MAAKVKPGENSMKPVAKTANQICIELLLRHWVTGSRIYSKLLLFVQQAVSIELIRLLLRAHIHAAGSGHRNTQLCSQFRVRPCCVFALCP